ncbi:hypothetical protein PV682_33430 [Streptomyces niveiscabiei]|uniref:hypothetical protein n=1 Tax=Streptomyces niveiscabiei TaxID=164115 RepID=UPI0029AB935C|nr:hypothetical protein [Streptomyces niveiscabiei]MDX3386321.1 hypothetical protein [Streptomyces niveiscabiei]
MGALAWLGIPLLAAIGAGLWGSWANRTRKARSDGPELDGYARFRAAMERPIPRDGEFRYAGFEDARRNVAPQDTPPASVTEPSRALEATAPEQART